MNLSLPNNNRFSQDDSSKPQQESLSAVKKKLEIGQELPTDSIKEVKAQNLALMRDTLQNERVDTVINVKQGQGTVNINTGTVNNTEVKKSIPAEFFLKQKAFTTSKVPFKGGRL
jgi:hypothetical protein